MVLTDETVRGGASEMSVTSNPQRVGDPFEAFASRHIGPGPDDVAAMLGAVGCASLEALIDETIPEAIRLRSGLLLPAARSEHGLLAELRAMASRNTVFRSMIGMGYYDCILPPVIQRNVLENPGWYTQYTPYQAEISQGRLEALMNFQTIVCELTGLPVANASLLDEATAAAEAMNVCRALRGDGGRDGFYVSDACHPQTLAVVRTRARSLGVRLQVGPADGVDCEKLGLFGVLLSYPTTDGRVCDLGAVIDRVHAGGALAVVATDLLALTLLRPPGAFGADIAVGSAQRFGTPMGFGGPHAAFISTRDEFKRHLPGRIVGLSKDAQGRPAYRLAIQTREQHIRRERATSNICTAQVLPAIMASMYAVYHGPDGLRRIAERVHAMTSAAAAGLRRLGHDCGGAPFFDTLRVRLGSGGPKDVLAAAAYREINLRDYDNGTVGLSLDETTTPEDLAKLFEAFNGGRPVGFSVEDVLNVAPSGFDEPLARGVDYLSHPVFHEHHCETEMLRYLYRLQQRDLSLATSMTPLGSCTMKLNGTSEMMPITWPEFAGLHPFAPDDQTRGYAELFGQLEAWLAEITGFAAVSLQPNAGAQGEYTGLMVLRAYHEARGEQDRDVCLIPTSAHGTNPASAVMAGLRVIAVACDARGNIDVSDLKAKAAEHRDRLAALMITYPSTHGVFEAAVREICEVVHAAGGQVYMDGANMNAQVGLCRPAEIGADVCHLNLHKTFCIPHGGGGPGAGPIGVAEHLAAFLPERSVAAGRRDGETKGVGSVSAAPYGSASILPISWMYIALMGAEGLARASQMAILNANYMAARLKAHYPILYTGKNGRVAHEFILDARAFKKTADVSVDDIAKRLMDYGFHAPTMSWPVPGTLMIEPTESESRAELDRFCDALIAIREEIRAIEDGRADRKDNALKGAPHTADTVAADDWPHAYGREQAAFPLPWVRERKFWPAVGRIDNVWGDRHLFCTCPPVEQ